MAETLLLGPQGSAWHEWLKDERRGRDVIILNPADAHHGPAGRFTLLQGDRAVPKFYGSTDPQRAPHVLLAALFELCSVAAPDAIIQLFAFRPTPLLRQLVHLIAFQIRPKELLIAKGTPIDSQGWPIGPEEIGLPEGVPSIVVDAQRKAQWLKLIERCHRHELSIGACALDGIRLGSGVALDQALLTKLGLGSVDHAEVCGGTLLLVADQDPDEDVIARALDATHAVKATVVHQSDYDDLLCAFVRPSGEEFGHGMIERIDFADGLIHVRADAIPEVPVPILRVGSLRVDKDGRERGEARPWQV